MKTGNYFARRYLHILREEPGLITQARIRVLVTCIIGFIFTYAILFALYILEERNFLLFRMAGLFVMFLVMLYILLKYSWKLAAHLFLSTITLVIWTNILFFFHGVNLVTVQYSVIVLSCSYFLLGGKWGGFYSVATILPLLGTAVLEIYTDAGLPWQHLQVNSHAYSVLLIYNYLLLMYIHYAFFRTYKTINSKESKLKENLQRAVVTAQELATAKTNFLSTMSHELRTPLNAVIGMTNILLMENPNKQQLENLNILKFSAENLMSTVNDILDFNKIEQENIKLEINPFRLDQLLKNVHGAFKAQAMDKQISLNCKLGPGIEGLGVLGDDERLAQILFNLLGNAIKFTMAGHVNMDVSLASVSKNEVLVDFVIEDTGIGIPSNLLATIFDPFIQVSSNSDRRFRGTGLGLTIAMKLLKMHGSELTLESVEGKGTTFKFTVKYACMETIAHSEVHTRKAAGTSLAELSVLVVEDEMINVMIMKKILHTWGIVPHVAANGALAVQAAMENHYDVVLMDINMPVMDGFEAAKRIRELPDEQKANVPIIAVTASVSAAVEQVSSNQHINDCLLKPFKVEHLKEKLERLL